MKPIIYATSNAEKFRIAQIILVQFGISLMQEKLDLTEIQSTSSAKIVLDKAAQAYAQLQQSVLVNNGTWAIPVLRRS